jgi:ATP-binding cassette subfamily B protein
LILDEATSALDSTTETKLLQALDAVTKDRSTLVIAHRLATIRKADKILVMDHGTIVEAGSFDELYAQGGRFTQLVKEQFSDASGKFIS